MKEINFILATNHDNVIGINNINSSGSFDQSKPCSSGSFDQSKPCSSGSFDQSKPSPEFSIPCSSGSFDQSKPSPGFSIPCSSGSFDQSKPSPGFSIPCSSGSFDQSKPSPGFSIPWKIKEDLQFFKKLTTTGSKDQISNMIIMGYNTFLSINCKPLPHRLNIVITSKYEKQKNQSNLIFLSSIKNAIYYGLILPNINNIWIIGGKQLFEQIDQIKPNNVYISIFNLKLNYSDNDNIIKLSDNFYNNIETNYSPNLLIFIML